jgi:Methyltransferase domain
MRRVSTEIEAQVLSEAGDDALRYFDFHRVRYEYLIYELNKAARDFPHASPLRILDVGQSLMTRLVRRALPNAIVNTLDNHDDSRYRDRDEHFVWDLNLTPRRETWPDAGRYHIVILAEVLEHLYTAPHFVLDFFSASLEEGGYLILQTPNAVSLLKRAQLLAGRNPFQLIRDDRSGHFREYTVKELVAMAQASDFRVVSAAVENYFRPARRLARAVNRVCDFLPQSLREGITMSLKKTTA